MATTLQLKTVKSIAAFCNKMPASDGVLTLMTDRTLALNYHNMTLSKEERAKQFPPFAIPTDALFEVRTTCSAARPNKAIPTAVLSLTTAASSWKPR